MGVATEATMAGAIIESSLQPIRAEVADTLRLRERRQLRRARNATSVTSQFIQGRRELVVWMREIVDVLDLHKSTLHTACNYLDRVVLHEEVPLIESFDVLVIACLRLGAKQCEKESAVPSARVFAEHCTARYGERDVARMEVSVLCSLGWVAHCSTAHDFYGSLVLGDLLRPGDAIGGQHGDARPIHRLSGPGALGASEEEVTVRKYAEFFLDLIVQEFAVDDQPASLNACSAVYAARMLLSICPTWAPELERETGYGSQALTNTVSHLLDVFARDYSDDWARLHDRMLSRGAVSGKDAEMLPLPSPTFVDEQLALTAY